MMVAALSLAALLSAVACGDDEASTTTSSSGSAGNGGSGGGLTPPPESCVQPGDVGNVNGVGTPCTPGGGECKPFPLAPVCLADFGQDEWFCTRIGCDATTDCGMGAGCLLESAGSACVPCVCDDAGVGCGGGTGGSGGGGGNGAGGTGGGGGN
jgi:hypothetical protein